MIIDNDKIVTQSLYDSYRTRNIKKIFDTKITEFSLDGSYDYLPGPEIKVLTPSGSGEKIWLRDTYKIDWICEEDSLIPEVDISYKTTNGEIVKISSVSNASTSSFNWTLQDDVGIGKEYSIIVNSYFDGELVIGNSPYTFEVDKRFIEIFPINDNKILANAGKIFPIKWNSNGSSNHVKVELYNSQNGQLLSVLNEKYFVETSNQYDWLVNNIDRTVDKVVIKLTDTQFPFVSDISDIIDVIVPYISVKSFTSALFNPTIRLKQFSTNMYRPSVHIKNFQIM